MCRITKHVSSQLLRPSFTFVCTLFSSDISKEEKQVEKEKGDKKEEKDGKEKQRKRSPRRIRGGKRNRVKSAKGNEFKPI